MINLKFLKANSTNYNEGRANKIKYLVIHYTANNGDTSKSNASYFANNKNLGASAHYFVDEKEVWQSVRDEDTAWHCGAISYLHNYCRNSNSIGIELCSRKNQQGYYFKVETVDNAIELIKKLMIKYGIDTNHILRHYDVTGKNCPAPFVEHKFLWDNFLQRLKEGEAYMTKIEVREIIQDEIKVYKYVRDIQNKEFRDTILGLIDKGYLAGESGSGENTILNLSEEAIRLLVILNRAGVFR